MLPLIISLLVSATGVALYLWLIARMGARGWRRRPRLFAAIWPMPNLLIGAAFAAFVPDELLPLATAGLALNLYPMVAFYSWLVFGGGEPLPLLARLRDGTLDTMAFSLGLALYALPATGIALALGRLGTAEPTAATIGLLGSLAGWALVPARLPIALHAGWRWFAARCGGRRDAIEAEPDKPPLIPHPYEPHLWFRLRQLELGRAPESRLRSRHGRRELFLWAAGAIVLAVLALAFPAPAAWLYDNWKALLGAGIVGYALWKVFVRPDPPSLDSDGVALTAGEQYRRRLAAQKAEDDAYARGEAVPDGSGARKRAEARAKATAVLGSDAHVERMLTRPVLAVLTMIFFAGSVGAYIVLGRMEAPQQILKAAVGGVLADMIFWQLVLRGVRIDPDDPDSETAVWRTYFRKRPHASDPRA